jgi:hypothetical protein
MFETPENTSTENTNYLNLSLLVSILDKPQILAKRTQEESFST